MSSAGLKVNEPSMEDILASIRRIIAEDEEAMDASVPEEAASPLRNVLELAERHIASVSVPDTRAVSRYSERESAFLEDSLQPDPFIPHLVGGYEAEPPATAPQAAAKGQPAAKAAPAAEEALLSGPVGAGISEAFGRLSASVQPSPAKTVEDLMKEMLRPMLKAWLDDNLPSIVERLVQDEIERIARRRG